MADTVSKEQRSFNMSRIRSSGTKPELRLLALLHEMFPGAAIIEHPDGIPGRPDAWLPELGIAVFADGCFFHGCPEHGHIPHDNRAYWDAKLRRNQARDRAVNRLLRSLGIHYVRIWEHELGKNLTGARRKLRRAARRARSSSAETAPADGVRR